MPQADYGIDAPGVVRNLCLAGAACLLVGVLATAGYIPSEIRLFGGGVRILWVSAAWTAGACLAATGLWMLWSSKAGKLRERERLLDLREWRGDERVLDLGCGRGLLLNASARRTAAGMAVGVDKWQAEDLAGNTPEAPLENARLEGVAERVRIITGDMRALPFAGESFDVLVSRAAIHNIYDRAEREAAVREVVRVLKPGGEAILSDIRNGAQYRAIFRDCGYGEVADLYPFLLSAAWGAFTFGSFQPTLLRVRKPG